MGSVRLDPQIQEKLRQAAAAKGVTQSEIWRQALTEYCNREIFVSEMNTRFMPVLTHMAEQLAQDFPGMKVNLYSNPVGTKTDWQGHDWGIDCCFPNASEQTQDNTYLSVEAGHLTTKPIINASVGWPVEKQVFPEYQNADDDTFEKILQELPRLFEALKLSLLKVGAELQLT